MLLFNLLFLKKTDLCLPLPKKCKETFAHKNKHKKISLNTSADK